MDAPQVSPPPFDPFMVGPWMEAVRRSWEAWFEFAFPMLAGSRGATATAPGALVAPVVPPVAPVPSPAAARVGAATGLRAEAPPMALPVLPTPADVTPSVEPVAVPPVLEPPVPTPDTLEGWLDHLIEVRRRGLADEGRYVIPKTLLAQAAVATGEAETRLIRLVNARDPEHEGGALDAHAQRRLEDRVLGAAVAEITAHRQRTGRTEIPPEVLSATAAELRRSPAGTRRLLLQRLYADPAPAPASPAPAPPARPAARATTKTPPKTPKRTPKPAANATRSRGTSTGDEQPTKGTPNVAGDRDAVGKEFGELVNMTPAKLERWLDQGASKTAGQRKGKGKGESTGHAAGRRIVEIKRKRKAELTDDDVAHMRKVNGYIKRHLAQRPDGEVSDTRWRHSLMNWGHDPMAKTKGR